MLVEDLLGAIVRVRDEPRTFLVQCSAHVQVHLVTERYHEDVFVIDTFIYPTKELGLVFRRDRDEHRSLGIVSATRAISTSRAAGRSSISRRSPSSRATCSPAGSTRG